MTEYTEATPGAPTPTPPRPLGAVGTALWRRMANNLGPTDAEILLEVCQQSDRAAACSDLIASEGLTITANNIPRAHPLLAAELSARMFITKMLVLLDNRLRVAEHNAALDADIARAGRDV